MAIYEKVLGEDFGYMVSHVLGAVLLAGMGLQHLVTPGMSFIADVLGGVFGGFTNLAAMAGGVLAISMAIDLGMDGLEMDE